MASMAFRKCRQKIRKWNSEKVKFQSESTISVTGYAVLDFYIEEVRSYTESSCAAMLFAAEQVDLNEFDLNHDDLKSKSYSKSYSNILLSITLS